MILNFLRWYFAIGLIFFVFTDIVPDWKMFVIKIKYYHLRLIQDMLIVMFLYPILIPWFLIDCAKEKCGKKDETST